MPRTQTNAEQGGGIAAILCKPVCSFGQSLRGQGGWANCTYCSLGIGISRSVARERERDLVVFPFFLFHLDERRWLLQRSTSGHISVRGWLRGLGGRAGGLFRWGRGMAEEGACKQGAQSASSCPAASDFPRSCFPGACPGWGHWGGHMPCQISHSHIPFRSLSRQTTRLHGSQHSSCSSKT